MQSAGPGDRIKWAEHALPHGTPLYDRPQIPMTKEEIFCAWDGAGVPTSLGTFTLIIRAVEEHHGIKALPTRDEIANSPHAGLGNTPADYQK